MRTYLDAALGKWRVGNELTFTSELSCLEEISFEIILFMLSEIKIPLKYLKLVILRPIKFTS